MQTYTIGQISEKFDLPISTLRFYDKEGLFPHLQRTSGIRQFTDREIETLRVIECLKKSGLGIKDIKQFIEWCSQGSKTFLQRRELFRKQRANVEAEIERMNRVLDVLKYKCWYYEQAVKNGCPADMNAEDVPEDIREVYQRIHS